MLRLMLLQAVTVDPRLADANDKVLTACVLTATFHQTLLAGRWQGDILLGGAPRKAGSFLISRCCVLRYRGAHNLYYILHIHLDDCMRGFVRLNM